MTIHKLFLLLSTLNLICTTPPSFADDDVNEPTYEDLRDEDEKQMGDVVRIEDPFAWERKRLDKQTGKSVTTPSLLVFSHTVGSKERALWYLRTQGVMQHYMIDRDGKIYQLVDETHRAWHAGVSSWKDIKDVNSHSIGITLEGNGEENQFTPMQIQKLGHLARHLMKKYHIAPTEVLSFAEVATPYGRHVAPGVKMDWETLAKNFGVGLWVDEGEESPKVFEVNFSQLKKLLSQWGYAISDVESDSFDESLKNLIKAFHKRYDRSKESIEATEGQPSSRTIELLEKLLK